MGYKPLPGAATEVELTDFVSGPVDDADPASLLQTLNQRPVAAPIFQDDTLFQPGENLDEDQHS